SRGRAAPGDAMVYGWQCSRCLQDGRPSLLGMHHQASARPVPAARRLFQEPVAAKVPEITFLFWVIKLLTTAGGEATSDYLSLRGDAVAAVVEILIMAVALYWQFRTRRYVTAAYWFLALAIAIFGTGVSDA